MTERDLAQSGEGEEESTAQPDEIAEARPEGDLERLQQEVGDLRREKDEMLGLAQRAQADLANYRRRVEEERQDVDRQATARILYGLLDVVDDFERAVAHLPPEDDREPWVQGIAMIHQKLWSVLGGEGLAVISPEGQPFDPWEHEALFQEESDDHADGEVLRVVRNGYRLRERVLRPAQVTVARARATGS